MIAHVESDPNSFPAGGGCFGTRFSPRRSASVEPGESVLGIRENQRPREVSRTMAQRLPWLAICQLSARAERSHHRLDYGEHVERREVAVLLN